MHLFWFHLPFLCFKTTSFTELLSMDNSSPPSSSPSSEIPKYESNPPPSMPLSASSYFTPLSHSSQNVSLNLHFILYVLFFYIRFISWFISDFGVFCVQVLASTEMFNNNEEEKNLFLDFPFQTQSNMPSSFLEYPNTMFQPVSYVLVQQ